MSADLMRSLVMLTLHYCLRSAEPSSDVVEPPKFITARHVAAVFEKMGYDSAAGTKVRSGVSVSGCCVM
jgi:hypothetical protein